MHGLIGSRRPSQPDYIRPVSGFMLTQSDGERSWIKERLVSMDPVSQVRYKRWEASSVGLDGSASSLRLVDYGEDSTLVEWLFEISPIEGAAEENIIGFLGVSLQVLH